MPTLTSLLKAQIRDTAAGEVAKAVRRLDKARRQFTALRAIVKRQRRAIARLKADIGRLTARLSSRPRRGRTGVPIVRAVRRRLKLSRAKMGKLLGVSRWSVFAWETGRTTPTKEHVAKVRALKKKARRPRRRKRR